MIKSPAPRRLKSRSKALAVRSEASVEIYPVEVPVPGYVVDDDIVMRHQAVVTATEILLRQGAKVYLAQVLDVADVIYNRWRNGIAVAQTMQRLTEERDYYEALCIVHTRDTRYLADIIKDEFGTEVDEANVLDEAVRLVREVADAKARVSTMRRETTDLYRARRDLTKELESLKKQLEAVPV